MISLSDTPQKYTGEMPKNTYHQYCSNIYSQNGEDGIIAQLCKELGIQNGFCCEFGASDGISGSNTRELVISKNFTGLFIESNKDLFELCKTNLSAYSKAKVICEMVTPSNLALMLDSQTFPKDFDVLSIDIDSYDYDVWRDFVSHKPKIVIIEANSYRDPIMEEYYQKNSSDYQAFDPLEGQKPDRIQAGVSFLPLVKLGLQKGYIPVAFTGNVIFVAQEYVNKLKEFPYKLSNNPYDYIDLYTNLILWDKGNENWCTNPGLMFNTAVRNYYITFEKKGFNLEWIYKELSSKGQMIWKIEPSYTTFNASNYTIPASTKRIKIDVGLSTCAPQSQKWLDHDNDLFVFGFEPNPYNLEHLQTDPAKSNLGIGTRYHIFPVALSDVNEKQEMDFFAMAQDGGTSSLYRPIDLNLGPVKEKIKVPVYSLSHFFDHFPWERFPYIEYLKIDAQGSDFNILKGAKDYLRERVVFVTAEPEDRQYWGCQTNTQENMTDYLEKNGFFLIESPNTQDPTYLNKNFLSIAKDIFIYQRG